MSKLKLLLLLALFSYAQFALAQNKTVTGKVTDLRDG